MAFSWNSIVWYPNVTATRDIAVLIVRESTIAEGEEVWIHCTPGNTAATLCTYGASMVYVRYTYGVDLV
jgi:hypothetical protein